MGKQKSKGYHLREWLLALAISAFVWLIVSHLFVGFYEVRTTELNGDFQQGDILWVNKWEAGPRLPFSPLHIPFTDLRSDLLTFPYVRWGDITIERSDLIAFNSTFPNEQLPDRRMVSIGRVVGLPGDTIKIHFGKVYINDVLYLSPYDPILTYEVALIDTLHLNALIKKYNLKYVENRGGNVYRFSAHRKNALALAGDSLSAQFSRTLETEPNPMVFPNGFADQSGDLYGPVFIPSRGDTISDFYASELALAFEQEHFLGESQEAKDSTAHVFRCNYYFLLSDHRAIGNDSRYFGAIPEYLIIGKVGGQLWKNEKDDAF